MVSEITEVPLPARTLVMEANPQRQLLWLDGLLVLPIGSRIHIDNLGELDVPLDVERFPHGRADAVVTGVRLWGTQSPMRCLVLLVELTDPGSEGGWMIDR